MSKITIYSPPATAQIKACAVDFDLRRAPVPVHLVQYDKTIPILAVSLYKGSSPYTLPADAEVNVRMNKRNNLCVYNPALGCNESRDVVYVAVTPQMTTQDGTFEPILEVVINSGVAGTSPLQLVIRRNPVQEDAIEDTSEAKTLTELVSQAAASATAAAQSAGAAAASATAAAESKEAAAVTAENIKDSLNQIAENTAAVSQLKEATDALKDGKISKFYASSQGDTNLPDSDAGRIMDLKLYGKSEQKQYSGKNLLKPTLATTTSNGITCTANGDGTYTIDGAATDKNTYFELIHVFIAKAGITYRLTGCPTGGDIASKYAFLFRNGFKTDDGSGANFKFNDDTTDYVAIKIAAGYAPSKLVFKPMITTDTSATYDDFEPYVGGIPSPNPEYPQEIKSVVNPVVKVMGKNLYTHRVKESIENSIKVVRDGSYMTLSGTCSQSGPEDQYRADAMRLKKGTYILSYKVIGGTLESTGDDLIRILPINANLPITTAHGSMGFTLSDDSDIYVITRFNVQSVYTDYKLLVQIECGSTATDCEPYSESTATLPYTLHAIPVTNGGNVTIDGQQYIADYVDVERGKLVRMCKEFAFTGDEAWNMDSTGIWTSDNGNSFYTNLGYSVAQTGLLSNAAHFVARYPDSAFADNCVTVAGSGNQIEFIRTPYKTVSDFKAYLKANPVKLLAAPDTQDETDLTADEIAAFKALVSYYPVTNVSTTSDQLEGYTVFNYPISLANGWNYVKQQLGDTRDYLYGIDLMTAEAYVNSEYAAALAEIEV